METIFSIYRFDPSKDDTPRYKKYALEIDDSTTIMNVLNKIKDKSDGSLTFRKGCGSAICGTCAVKVNGTAKLACKTRVVSLLTAGMETPEITIEPLDKKKVIKDLVIEQSAFWEQMKSVMPWLVAELPKDKEAFEVSKEQLAILDKSQDCINCHACSTECDAMAADEKEFLGPEALVKCYRYVTDTRDTKTAERLTLATEKGMWNCAHAYNCIDACPKDIKPADKITKLREMAVDAGITGNRGARHANNFLDSLQNVGKLEEAKMPLKTLTVSVLGFVPDTVRMVSKGKMPPLMHKKIKDHDQVRKLIYIAKRRKEREA
jgi:succinate dehydrogenase / fumarate reductase iron-sulfur subunit